MPQKVNLIPVDEWEGKIKKTASDKSGFLWTLYGVALPQICNTLADWADLIKRSLGKSDFKGCQLHKHLIFSNLPFILALIPITLRNFLTWRGFSLMNFCTFHWLLIKNDFEKCLEICESSEFKLILIEILDYYFVLKLFWFTPNWVTLFYGWNILVETRIDVE